MTNGLGPFWVPHHRRPDDYDVMQVMQPNVIKIQDGGPPDYQWVRDHCPASLVLARDWAIGEQHSDMAAAPEVTGKRHAQFWADKRAALGFIQDNTICLGINEPKIWEPGQLAACAKYTLAFLDECKRLGLRGGALQLSVGWPNNSGPDTPPVWSGFVGVKEAILRGNHVLVTHEYWADKGPKGESWGWWAGRILKCPWDVPIVIGECGFEMAVKKPVDYDKRGWRAYITPDAYADQLVEYHNALVTDPRIRGVCVFSHDYANNEWWTVDVHDAYPAIKARKAKLLNVLPYTPGSIPVPPPVEPPPVVVPPAATPTMRWPLDTLRITQWYGENPAAYAKFGLRGHNGVDFGCAVGTPVKAAADGVVMYVADDPAGYGLYIRIWHKALGVHSMHGHLSKQSVKVGDAVKQGQVIGLSGNTGNSTGPHLHYELRLCDANGMYMEPLPGYGKACDPVTFYGLLNNAAVAGGGGSNYFPPDNPVVSPEFTRALEFVLKWEGGWSDNAEDPGGATMHGITLATYTAWRRAHGYDVPSKAALKEITAAEVQAIYWYEYWQASGCEMLQWPLALAHFDAAVNTGVGQAATFLNSTHNFDGYMAARIDWYTRLKTWPTFGAGWTRRCADLLKEAAG